MKVWLETDRQRYRADVPVVARLFALNDSFQPVELDRLALVGPNPMIERAAGLPWPVSVEPSLEPMAQNLVTLNPSGIYGRQRIFDNLPPGEVILHGYLLRARSDQLLPERPVDGGLLAAAAEPLKVFIEPVAPVR